MNAVAKILRKSRAVAVTTALLLCPCPPGMPEMTSFSSLMQTATDTLLQGGFVRYQEPDLPTFEELKAISLNPKVGGGLKKKLEKLWTTPIISNEAYHRGVQPHHPRDLRLGNFLRVASWNIEKSLHIQRAVQLLTYTPEAFDRMINFEEIEKGSEEHKELHRQRNRLLEADVLILQEMEIGIKRSGYVNAAEELAKALDMNYAYGTQYLEVDPVILGLETLALEDGKTDEEAMNYYRVDPAKFKGMFGSAVLSRYPIKHVELRPLRTQPYNWYEGEKERIGFLEEARRFGTKTVFENEITREMKVGGRHYFRVDLEVPHLPGKTLTIINIHLEIKCQPKGRERQMREILSYIKDIKHPLIMMGDFNAAPTDISPTSVGRTVKRTLKNPTTWFAAAVNYISPYGLAVNTTRGVSNVTKNFNDPFAKDVKVIAPNPLKKMFAMIKDHRFSDGHTFDFRGDPKRSMGNKDDLLANSNQRGRKGFKTTFSTRRTIGNLIGKLRLDWVFVKAYTLAPEAEYASYQFAPHFGETLEEMNSSLIEPISDHHPNVVDLPFEEPSL